MFVITGLRYITLVVKDIETSLAWYCEKMGFEKRMDIKKPGSRWVSIGIAGQANPEIILQIPSAEEHGDQFEKKNRQIGNTPTWVLTVDDCLKTVEEFRARGVEIAEEPNETPWGVTALIKDLYGNCFSLSQSF
ncbi:MAG: lactoylglutathione lyase [Proteobacteria bacterium]|nr:MAG: lactoylglutathione lyase [Pseudomonadota bacterium]